MRALLTNSFRHTLESLQIPGPPARIEFPCDFLSLVKAYLAGGEHPEYLSEKTFHYVLTGSRFGFHKIAPHLASLHLRGPGRKRTLQRDVHSFMAANAVVAA